MKDSTQMTQISADQWMSVKEYAEMKGISERAVRKNIAAGKYQVKEVPHPSRTDQVSYMVFVESAEPECGTAELRNCGTSESAEPCEPCEPCEPTEADATVKQSLRVEAKRQDDDSTIGATASAGTIDFVPYHKMDEAQLYALLMQEIDRRLGSAESKTEEWARITEDYNEKRLVPELRRLKGRRSERGLRHWHTKWQRSNQDMFEMVHKNTAMLRGRKVTYIEQRFLEGALLCGWEKPIMTAIRELKAQAALGAHESPSSIPTLKRWCRDFAEDNPAVWVQGRKGDKAVKDTVVKSIMRDDRSIKPLQVFVVDGHKLSVFVKHPITGKPFRPTLIMIFDWGSRYPVGMSLALTEDSAHTLTAVRNALLNSEYIPPFIYLDNGKAFRSKLFNAKWEEHDLEYEFAGIFPKLGIEAHFAKAYNARSKNVERFFKTMQDQWEKRQASYCGTSIQNKPAHMARNEKWMQEMYGAKAMEYNECMASIYEWIRWEYGMAVHQSLKAKPYEVFAAAERSPDRAVNPVELNFLMLTAERKKLREEGIMLYKNRYWAPELVDHIGKSVVIRYDYNDLRSILVYDMQSRPICQATMRESQCGWVFADLENPMAAQKLWAEDREISGLHRRIKKDTKRIVTIAKKAVDEEVKKNQDIIEQTKAERGTEMPSFVQPPMMPAPQRRYDVNDDVKRLEEMAKEVAGGRFQVAGDTQVAGGRLQVAGDTQVAGGKLQVAEDSGATASAGTGKVINLEDLLREDEGELAGTVSFQEMQKIIGIER